jgi:hypothetical protein
MEKGNTKKVREAYIPDASDVTNDISPSEL